MEEFYSKVVPRIRNEKDFGKAGLHTKLELGYYNDESLFTRFTLIVIFHAVVLQEDYTVVGVRNVLENLVKQRILWPNPIEYWLEKFLVKLLTENYSYFCAETMSDFEALKLSMYVRPAMLM